MDMDTVKNYGNYVVNNYVEDTMNQLGEMGPSAIVAGAVAGLFAGVVVHVLGPLLGLALIGVAIFAHSVVMFNAKDNPGKDSGFNDASDSISRTFHRATNRLTYTLRNANTEFTYHARRFERTLNRFFS